MSKEDETAKEPGSGGCCSCDRGGCWYKLCWSCRLSEIWEAVEDGDDAAKETCACGEAEPYPTDISTCTSLAIWNSKNLQPRLHRQPSTIGLAAFAASRDCTCARRWLLRRGKSARARVVVGTKEEKESVSRHPMRPQRGS